MKQVILVWSLVVTVVLAGCQPVIVPPTPGPTEGANGAEVASGDDLYLDPAGRFSVPVPTNWTATTRDDYVWLTSPDEQIQVAIVVVPGEELEANVAQAWSTVDPTLDAPVLRVTELPPTPGVERAISVDYDTEEGEPVMAAVALLADGSTYTLLFRGELVAISQRAAQLAIIQTGFQIAGIEEVNLAGVMPLPFDETIRAEFEDYIQQKLEDFSVPGAAIAVVQDGEVVFSQGFGVRALGSDVPVTPETLMMIGSTGKTMTTLMMATVVDDGLMTWDTPVQEVLPQFAVADPELSRRITMRNLVCACTGVPRRDLQLIFNADDMTAEDTIASLAEFDFFTGFGEAFQYSNQMVATAGFATAAAAGGEWGHLYDAYVEEMQTRVFDPVGMEETTLSFEKVLAGDNYALPHVLGIEVPYEVANVNIERIVLPVAPAGAPWSNVLDMTDYLIMELNRGVAADGTRVVSEENLAVTWEPQVPVSAKSYYGLGWFIDEYKGQPLIHHGGNTLGYTSDFAFMPEAGIGITILTNGRATDPFNEAVRFRLLELLFEQPVEYDAQANFLYQTIRDITVSPVAGAQPVEAEAVAPFLGSYVNASLGELELEWVDDMLIFDVGEFQMEVRQAPADEATGEVTEGEYVIYGAPMAGIKLRLEMTDAGTPQVVFGSGVDEYIYTPVE